MSTDQLEFRPQLEIYCIPNLDPADVAKAFKHVGDRLFVDLYVSKAYDPSTGRVVLDFSEKLTAVAYEEVIGNLKARRGCVISVTKLLACAQQPA